jgi:glycosyltransferase involved in cell wall biosynthesis
MLIRGLAPEFTSAVAVRPGSEAERRLAATGMPIIPVPMRGEWDILSAERLRRIARDTGAALLHAHTGHAHALTLSAARALRLPLVVSRRVEHRPWWSPFERRKYLMPGIWYVTVSQAVATGLLAAGIPPDRVSVISDGVDLTRFGVSDRAAIRRQLGCEDGEVLFGNVAAMSPEKDQATLLEAFARVEREAPSVRLVVVGSGPLERKLRDLAASLGLKRVLFTGWRDDVPEILGGLDVFVLTSRREGLGSSIAEAFASGLPAIATRAGGIPEMIRHDEDGLLVDPGDVAALAKAMLEMARDPARRCRLGSGARERAKVWFGARRMVERHAELYRRLLG